MEIIFKKGFRFDHEMSQVIAIPFSEEDNDFNSYVEEIITDVVVDNRRRKYSFPDEPTAIKTIIGEIITGGIDTGTLKAANRLLRVEGAVQQRIEQLDREVQKGILIQSLVNYNEQKIFIIIKAEHLDFINEDNNKRAKGLPIKKKIFKSFCAYINEENCPSHSMVSDSKKAIAVYWWSTFLELVEEHTDSYNTQKAFDALDNNIFSKLRKIYPQDYMYLRNATVQYFRSNDEFVLEDYVVDIIQNYIPEDDKLNIAPLERNILALPETANFDTRFSIKKEELNKRIINKIKLTPQLVLEIKENINWETTVKAFEEEGVKYIKIRTDEGYKYFKKDN